MAEHYSVQSGSNLIRCDIHTQKPTVFNLSINYLFQIKLSVYHKVEVGFVALFGIENLVIDVCRVLDDKSNSIFINMLLSEIKNNTNLMHSCPYEVN